MKNRFFLLLIALFVSVVAYGQRNELASPQDSLSTLPKFRKVENVTIKDLYGNYTKLPHFGEKNLLIFY
ncbi:MAG: hypothetical protein IIX82_00055, partial [Alistipes sp.]|nr:hypothetical protein [Alistipes sp.]